MRVTVYTPTPIFSVLPPLRLEPTEGGHPRHNLSFWKWPPGGQNRLVPRTRTQSSVSGQTIRIPKNEAGPPTKAAHHANTRISPIPIRVFTPAIATPRQISAGMLSDWSLTCLRNTAFFHAVFPARIYQAGTGESFRAKVQKCT